MLFQDAEAALDLAAEHSDAAAVRGTGWLLVKILGDALELDDQGQPKRQFQRLWTAAAVNLKRLFKLAKTRQVDLAVAFNQTHVHRCGLMPA